MDKTRHVGAKKSIAPSAEEQLAGRRQPGKLPFHRINLREVVPDVVVAAALAGG